ncbi:MAG: anti-sigma-factor antagonist [Actinomycetia bacterium]|nr:anti-sigma-factor antagonist [Actinomycetes bacterium]
MDVEPFNCMITETSGGTVLVRVAGDVDMATGPTLAETLEQAFEIGGSVVIIDITNVHFMDSSGLTVLVQAQKRADTDSTLLILRGAQPRVTAVLELTGTASLFRVDPAE